MQLLKNKTLNVRWHAVQLFHLIKIQKMIVLTLLSFDCYCYKDNIAIFWALNFYQQGAFYASVTVSIGVSNVAHYVTFMLR